MIELLLVAEQLIDDGAYERAEVLFEQVSQADPRNAIAVAGLARVALARGDRDRAFDEARRALAIDPEEVAAQRLINELIATAEAQDDGAAPGQKADPGHEADSVPPAHWSADPPAADETRLQAEAARASAEEARAQGLAEVDEARAQVEAAAEVDEARAQVEAAAEVDEARAQAEAAEQAREQAAAAAEARAQAWALAQAGAAEARAQAIAKARVAAAEARAEATAVAEAAAAEAAAAQAASAGQRVIPKSAGATPEPRSLLARLLGLFGIRR